MTAIRDAIQTATADRKVTSEEWNNVIKPVADQTPKEASADAREVVALWANDGFQVEAGARDGMRNYLVARGYDTPASRPAGSAADVAQALIDSNVSEVDGAFQDIATRAGRADAEINVAVLDSGFDTAHQALDTKLWTNPGEVAGDRIDNDGNGKVDDVHGWDFASNDNNPNSGEAGGHATHVTGIATRGTDNIDAMSLRVFSPLDGRKVAEAIDYAAANGVKVMNMSFRVDDRADKQAIVDAMRRHPEILFLKSAGNDGRDLNGYNETTYLAKQQLPNLVIAASSDAQGNRSSFSNFGTPFATHGAVGSAVNSSVPGGGFQKMSGTSMASPHVANLAAKVLLLDPALSPPQVKGIMTDTTDVRQDWADLTTSGGTVNAERAYQVAGVTGLVRGGLSPQAAADRLGLTGGNRDQVLSIAARYLS